MTGHHLSRAEVELLSHVDLGILKYYVRLHQNDEDPPGILGLITEVFRERLSAHEYLEFLNSFSIQPSPTEHD